MSIQRFNAPKSVVKAIVRKDMVRSALESLSGEFKDVADLQLFRAFIREQGGLLKFAKELIGEEQVALLRRHFREVRIDPDYSGPKSLPEVAFKLLDKTRYDDTVWRQRRMSVLETSVLRKEYVQTLGFSDRQVTENVNGVLVTKVEPGEATRDVPAYVMDKDEVMDLKSIIPYHRDENGNVMTVGMLKRQLGIPSGEKQWDNRPVLQVYITREGSGRVELAAKAQLKLRHEYDVALKLAVDRMNQAKASGKYDVEVRGLFAAAAAKKVPWQLLTDAIKFYLRKGGVGETEKSLDTGFGPWPCHTTSFPKGNFILAHRIVRTDMTDSAKAIRDQRVAEFKARIKCERQSILWAEIKDLPML